jgi:hypothetical protein
MFFMLVLREEVEHYLDHGGQHGCNIRATLARGISS